MTNLDNPVQQLVNPTEKIYFAGLVLYILLYLQYETQWAYGETFSWIIKSLALALLIVQTALTFPKYTSPKLKLLFILSLILTCVVGTNAGILKGINRLYESLITFLLVFGAKDIDFRKILKVFLLVGGTYSLITVISSLTGVIPNLEDESTRPEDAVAVVDVFSRQSLGYGWSTNMANHVFFILLTYFCWVNRCLKKKEMLLYFAIAIGVLSYTGSRLSAISIILMLVLTLLLKRKWGERFLTSKLVCFFIVVSVPFFLWLSYYATENYDDADFNWMVADVILSGRLRLGNDAFEIAGIPMFGQFYEMFSSARDDGDAYNYLDNSYVQSLVVYGLIYTVVLVVAYAYVCRSAYYRKDYFLLYSVFFAGMSGLIAQHFIEMYMNPFLIALFASHQDASLNKVSQA